MSEQKDWSDKVLDGVTVLGLKLAIGISATLIVAVLVGQIIRWVS